MLLKNLLFVLAALLIAGLTLVEARFSDRWHDSSVDADEFGQRFKNVPMAIGSWQGEDLEVDEAVRKKAGAVHAVSRSYKDEKTGRVVTVWLIVGHARDICRHTPNICYPSSGFKQTSSTLKYHMNVPGENMPVFNTAKFEKSNETGRYRERVFWAWNHPDVNRWEAPANQRLEYGNSRALYKLYFTSSVAPGEETIEENIAIKFAEQMLPLIDAALFPSETPFPSETEQAPAAVPEQSTESLDAQPTATEPAATEAPKDEPLGVEPDAPQPEEKSIFDAVS